VRGWSGGGLDPPQNTKYRSQIGAWGLNSKGWIMVINRLIDYRFFIAAGSKKSTVVDSNRLIGLYHQGWAASPVYNPPVLAVDYRYERHLQRHANKYADFHGSIIDFPKKGFFRVLLRVASGLHAKYSICSYWFIDYRFSKSRRKINSVAETLCGGKCGGNSVQLVGQKGG